jgi:hypothetical protein
MHEKHAIKFKKQKLIIVKSTNNIPIETEKLVLCSITFIEIPTLEHRNMIK